MKRILYALLLPLLAAVSCGRNGLYISVDNTAWEITMDTQVGWPVFLDDEHVSLIQLNYDTHYYQTMNGTFQVDGHRVDVSADGSAVRMVRTFSHLKNSSNKNYRSIKPEEPGDIAGSVWAVLKSGDLQLTFFQGDGTCISGVYENVTHREGIHYGWSWTSARYAVNGNQLTAGTTSGTFYKGFLRMPSVAVPRVSESTHPEGTSSLKGTVWKYNNAGSYPGFLIFTSATEFVRVLVQNATVFTTLEGTYRLKGNSLEFHTDSEELNRSCTIADGQFTYLEKTYSIVSSF